MKRVVKTFRPLRVVQGDVPSETYSGVIAHRSVYEHVIFIVVVDTFDSNGMHRTAYEVPGYVWKRVRPGNYCEVILPVNPDPNASAFASNRREIP